MKNSITIDQRFSRSILVMLTVISVSFLFGSCEKQEMLLSPDTTNANARALPNQPVSSVLVQIEHISLTGTAPEYKVTLYSTGKVIFEGRKNVSHLGFHYSNVEPQTVEFIRNMFLAAHFFNLPSATISRDVTYYVETTFVYGSNVKTIRDLNNGTPQMILQLRKKTESLLGIGTLVDWTSQEATLTLSD